MTTRIEQATQKAYEREDLNAFITVVETSAHVEDDPTKPLNGVPFAVKDNIAVAGIPMTCASEQFADRIPDRNASVVDSLLDAGAAVIGKTNMDECSYGTTGEFGLDGPVHNPWNMEMISGGSSSGSAAAVTAGIVPFALGTDTGGSARIPASLCGIWSYRPTHNLEQLQGVHELVASMDTIGVMASSSSWLVRVWHALAGAAVSVRREPKIAWLEGTGLPPIDPEVLELTRSFMEPVCTAQYEAPWLPILEEAYRPIRSSEAYAMHEHFVSAAPDKYQPRTLNLLARDQAVRGWQYFRAHASRERLKHDLLQIFDQVDYLALPTTPVTAPPIGTETVTINDKEQPIHEALMSLTSPWSVLGWPVLGVPAGFIDGMPIGVQIVGRPGSDKELIGFASWIAGALPTASTSA